jgi:hypothetical protein
MRVFCPNCNAQIDSKDFNTAENICVCHACNELFKLSEILDQDAIYETEKLLRNPPKGAWVRKDIGKEIIGISTRSKSAIFIILFALAFSGVSFLGLFQMIISESAIGILFMLIFIAASISLWGQVFYSIFGKIEFVTNKNGQDYIFAGIGRIGKKHVLKWPSIKSIYEQTSHSSEDGSSKKIFIEGENLIKIPINGINENKSMFLIKVLKYYKDKKDRFQQFQLN